MLSRTAHCLRQNFRWTLSPAAIPQTKRYFSHDSHSHPADLKLTTATESNLGSDQTRPTADKHDPLHSRAPGSDPLASDATHLATHSSTPYPIPPPVSGWPTPWIAEEHFDQYINGLYDRGWGIHFSTTNSKFMRPLIVVNSDDTSSTKPPVEVVCRVPELLKTYQFSKLKFAFQFVNDLEALMTKEKHHCALHITDPGNPQVTVYLHTHTARPPSWKDVSLDFSKAPGITLRDIRFAMLCDELHERDYLAKDTGIAPKLRVRSQMPSWDKFERRLKANLSSPPGRRPLNLLLHGHGIQVHSTPSDLPHEDSLAQSSKSKSRKRRSNSRKPATCPACGMPHTLQACEARHSIQPPKPCSTCRGNHWRIDCPRRGRWIKHTSLRPHPSTTCSKCGSSHLERDCTMRDPPLHSCPNCGGDHWKIDCRMPQISPERAESLKLPIP